MGRASWPAEYKQRDRTVAQLLTLLRGHLGEETGATEKKIYLQENDPPAVELPAKV